MWHPDMNKLLFVNLFQKHFCCEIVSFCSKQTISVSILYQMCLWSLRVIMQVVCYRLAYYKIKGSRFNLCIFTKVLVKCLVFITLSKLKVLQKVYKYVAIFSTQYYELKVAALHASTWQEILIHDKSQILHGST